MKTDLDSLMQTYNQDALIVLGPGDHNAAMMYLTGGGHFNGILIKKQGAAPLLFCNDMERDEAAKTGLTIKKLSDYKYEDILTEVKGDHLMATVIRYQKMLADAGVTSGRVVLYGKIEIGPAYAAFSALQAAAPGLTFVGELSNSMLMQARATKDAPEIDRIRRMGLVTTQVVGNVADWLTSQRVKDGVLVQPNGQPVTVGDVKQRINLWLAEREAENPEGTIFAIGRDAGVPHSSGNPADILRLGQTIVFDIFPCEQGGGYYYDFTRTWCLGYATDEAQALYEDVLTAYHQITNELKVGAPFKNYQKKVCDLFEAKGHTTVQSNPQTQSGYVHSLGHGLGLNVHERPWSGSNASDADCLFPGSVMTIEPGLYYPERGLGVRLEDTVWMRPDGQAEILAPYPLDLVLPIGSPASTR